MLAGAAVAVFLSGTREVEATVAFVTLAGVAALVARPVAAPRGLPVALGLLFLALTLLVQLPQGFFPVPDWRSAFPANSIISLGDRVAAMPAHALWWSAGVAATLLASAVVLTLPLKGRELALFLHLVAFVAAAYAAVSIVDRQTDWSFPFAADAVFGLLPNRNHTATLLVVGSVVAFGLMQWELVRGHRAGAAIAALCGAPPLAALLFFSISRAGVLMLCAGFAIWALGAASSAINRRALVVSAAVLVFFLAGLFVLGGSTVRDRITDLLGRAVATEPSGADALDFRMPVFKDTVRMISDAPLTGAGLGHFSVVFPHYRDASVRAAAVFHPESDWLMVAAECGWPAVAVLVALAAWFLVTLWRARAEDDGLLRWTVASAICAALLHGLIDAPWHRNALGWFLLVTALVAVPGGRGPLRWPGVWRGFQIVVGLAMLGAGGYLAWQAATSRPPLPFRWPAYNDELSQLAQQRKHDDGVVVAKEAITDFPLRYEAYYWYAAFLRTFLGTEPDMAEAGLLGRFVEPIQPRVAAEQAQVWVDIDPANEAALRVEAIRRARRIGEVEGRSSPGSVEGEILAAINAARSRPGVQLAIGRDLAADPLSGAAWLRWADPQAAAQIVSTIPDLPKWLDAMPEKLRRETLERIVTLPVSSAAVAYMEERSYPPPGLYWRALAAHDAAGGNKPGAIARVAQATSTPLDSGGRGINDFGRQLADLEAQGNDVAVRRLLSEASAPDQKDTDKLAVAMAWFAAAGDWENSWKAASRLASLTKIED
jgi:hypothetical protein